MLQYLDPNHFLPPLEHAFRAWMSNEVLGGGENCLHSRNDGLMNILKLLGDLNFFDRDNGQPSQRDKMPLSDVELFHLSMWRRKGLTFWLVSMIYVLSSVGSPT